MQNQSNPRFNDYIEIIKNNEVVGFKLDNNEFQFLFDKYGGWYDEDGKYYNAQAVECPKPEDQSDDDDEEEDPQAKFEQCQAKDVIGKLEECLIGLNVTDQNQRLQTVRNLTQIIQSYPSNEEIIIILTLQPPQPNQDQVIEKYLKEKLNRQLKVQKGEVIGVFDQQLALSIAQLEGTYIHDIKATIYVDVELFDCLKISTLMRKSELQTILNEHRFKKNIDYGNIEEEKNQKGEYECWLEINADIEDQLRDFVDFIVEEE